MPGRNALADLERLKADIAKEMKADRATYSITDRIKKGWVSLSIHTRDRHGDDHHHDMRLTDREARRLILNLTETLETKGRPRCAVPSQAAVCYPDAVGKSIAPKTHGPFLPGDTKPEEERSP